MDLLVLTQSISSVGFFLFVSTGLANLWLGYLVLKHNPKGASNRIFFLLSIIIFLWLFVSYASLLSVFVSTSLIWIRLTIFFAVPLCLFVYFFSYSIPKGKFDIGMGNLIVILSITGLVMLVTISPYAFTSIDLVDNFPSPVPGYGLPIFVLYVIISISSSVRLLIIKLKKATGVARMQISFILLGIILMFSLILFTLVLPVALISDATFVSFSPLYTLIFLGLTAYTIIKLRLLEIRFVLSRSIAYTILSVLISALFVLVTFLTSTYFSSESQIIQIGILILSSLFVVLILDPAKSLLAKVTDKIFFKAAINYPVVTKELSDVINEEIQLTGLISRFSITLQRDLRIESVRVLLPKDDVYVPYTVSGNKDNSISISANSYLVSELMKTDSVLLLDELDRKVALANERSILIKYTQIRILFEANNIYCIVPITTDQQLVSILVLSQKLSGETFSRNDVQLLDVVAPQMASGIQKA
ncbi:MAG: histidine kinase N-terminal 7TM domain-containing protein, partial [bacterium]|nr:histidine kinase N-terminal 7TM domain-containing protein [bacterium]